MRWRDAMMAALALTTLATGALAGRGYACGPWQPGGVAPALDAINIMKSMAILTSNGRDDTIRMARGQLDLRIYPDDTGLYIVHGTPVATDNGPAFGPRIRVQRLIHDPLQPHILQTECEAVK